MRSKVRKICRLLSIIDRIRIGRQSRLGKQWRLLRILSIYAKTRHLSRLTNLIIQPWHKQDVSLHWNVHSSELELSGHNKFS